MWVYPTSPLLKFTDNLVRDFSWFRYEKKIDRAQAINMKSKTTFAYKWIENKCLNLTVPQTYNIRSF